MCDMRYFVQKDLFGAEEAPPLTLQKLEQACLSCDTTMGYQAAGTGPHWAALRCAECDRFIKWLPKPVHNSGEDQADG